MPSDVHAWQSDGHRLHAIPCGSIAGPDHGGLTSGELPLPWQIDLSNALAETRRRLWPDLEDGEAL